MKKSNISMMHATEDTASDEKSREQDRRVREFVRKGREIDQDNQSWCSEAEVIEDRQTARDLIEKILAGDPVKLWVALVDWAEERGIEALEIGKIFMEHIAQEVSSRAATASKPPPTANSTGKEAEGHETTDRDRGASRKQ